MKTATKIEKMKWTWTNSNHPDFIDIDADTRVCSIDISEEVLREQEYTKEEAIERAAFICKAVNEYENLVNALKDLLFLNEQRVRKGKEDEAVERAREAIKLAESKDHV